MFIRYNFAFFLEHNLVCERRGEGKRRKKNVGVDFGNTTICLYFFGSSCRASGDYLREGSVQARLATPGLSYLRVVGAGPPFPIPSPTIPSPSSFLVALSSLRRADPRARHNFYLLHRHHRHRLISPPPDP